MTCRRGTRRIWWSGEGLVHPDTAGARICDPQRVTSRTDAGTNFRATLPSTRCGSQSRAPEQRPDAPAPSGSPRVQTPPQELILIRVHSCHFGGKRLVAFASQDHNLLWPFRPGLISKFFLVGLGRTYPDPSRLAAPKFDKGGWGGVAAPRCPLPASDLRSLLPASPPLLRPPGNFFKCK